MAIFLVRATREAPTVAQRIQSVVPDSHLAVTEDTWLIDYNGMTRELADALGFLTAEARNGAGLVVAVENYSGRASADVWEWLKQHWPAKMHGG
jgi:hypothetical protein